jgi:hypothetical protein
VRERVRVRESEGEGEGERERERSVKVITLCFGKPARLAESLNYQIQLLLLQWRGTLQIIPVRRRVGVSESAVE